MQALDHLKKIIFAIQPLQEEVWNEFSSIWKPYEAKRKTLLTKAGETERYLYFVLDGVQRGFYAHDDGREATIVFTYAFSFSGIADSFLLQQPSRFFLETLTASSFLRTEYRQVSDLWQRYPDFQSCMFKSLRCFGKTDRAAVLFCRRKI